MRRWKATHGMHKAANQSGSNYSCSEAHLMNLMQLIGKMDQTLSINCWLFHLKSPPAPSISFAANRKLPRQDWACQRRTAKQPIADGAVGRIAVSRCRNKIVWMDVCVYNLFIYLFTYVYIYIHSIYICTYHIAASHLTVQCLAKSFASDSSPGKQSSKNCWKTWGFCWRVQHLINQL